MILVTGAGGQLGAAFMRLLGDGAMGTTRDTFDLTATGSIAAALDRLAPKAIINCAAYTAVDRAESEEELAHTINAEAVGEMARWAGANEAGFVTFSTDYVFDGEATTPYYEDSPTGPLNVYGRTKLSGELLALEGHPGSLVIRTSWVLSGDHPNFAATMLRLARTGPLRVVADQTGVPNFVDELAQATMAASTAGLTGLLHLSGPEPTTWHALARAIVRLAGYDPDLVEPIRTEDYPVAATRPAYGVLASRVAPSVGIAIESWRETLPGIVEQLQEWV